MIESVPTGGHLPFELFYLLLQSLLRSPAPVAKATSPKHRAMIDTIGRHGRCGFIPPGYGGCERRCDSRDHRRVYTRANDPFPSVDASNSLRHLPLPSTAPPFSGSTTLRTIGAESIPSFPLCGMDRNTHYASTYADTVSLSATCANLPVVPATANDLASRSASISIWNGRKPESSYRVPIDTKVASGREDEKRRRNAKASALSRQRRKKREEATADKIESLEQEVKSLQASVKEMAKETECLRGEVERYRHAFGQTSGEFAKVQLPPIFDASP